LHYPERTEELRVKHGANVRFARLLNPADQNVTGIIEDDVKCQNSRELAEPHAEPLRQIRSSAKENGVAEASRKIGNVCQCAGGGGDVIAACERGFGPTAVTPVRTVTVGDRGVIDRKEIKTPKRKRQSSLIGYCLFIPPPGMSNSQTAQTFGQRSHFA
jgi:hypothetical protein